MVEGYNDAGVLSWCADCVDIDVEVWFFHIQTRLEHHQTRLQQEILEVHLRRHLLRRGREFLAFPAGMLQEVGGEMRVNLVMIYLRPLFIFYV